MSKIKKSDHSEKVCCNMGKKNVAGKTTPQPKQRQRNHCTEDSSKTDVEEDSD